MKLNVKKLDEKAIIPTYGSTCAAGADLYALSDGTIEIKSKEGSGTEVVITLPLPKENTDI